MLSCQGIKGLELDSKDQDFGGMSHCLKGARVQGGMILSDFIG